ncbi:MAG: Vitamin B12 transporter BtuB [Chroococcidiopsis sp. SAG 2025]|uniref:TonB-dependent siderophore receptor n=1 Tax=Chroococcidiopsis sp. SAG 2025 TaxID=171389 RepID=UPI002937392F|nr:TonB-dependent siderophore receptor [Chroococcidiopsis sp. SAG 2025]MDV2998174.1 Vitamin B12 transporter BtuB [Chroococcidiopsis sp. SAG 2025]
MRLDRLWQSLLLTSAIAFLLGTPAKGEEVGENIPEVNNNIPQLSEVELPATSAQTLVQTPPPDPPSVPPNLRGKQGGEAVSITGVVTNPTDQGVEIILQTTQGKALQPVTLALGRSYIANIPNAVLALPQGEFRQDNPASGITRVAVTQATANSIRVTVTGEAALPSVQLYDSPNEGLIFSFTPGTSTAQPTAEADEQREIVVTGEQDGYNVPNTSVGTRTDTPLRDIPQSIQVVPQEVLRDQNVNSLDEALRNVSGVTTNSGPDSFGDASYNIRGFSTAARSGGNFLRNGLREGGDILQDFTPNIERIEALLGPASVLYGNANPGGTINIVTKQPLRDPFYAIDATIGNYDFYEGAIDLSGPLNDSKTLLYRLNVGYQDRGSFIDFVEASIFTVSPVVSVDIGERTRLTLEGEYTERSIVSYQGLPAVGTVLPNPNGEIPRERFTGEPDGVIDTSITRVGYRLEHQFSDNWSLQNAFSARIQRSEPGNEFYIITEDGLADDNRTLNRQAITNTVDYEDYDLATYLTGKFSTGSIDHQLLLGIDLSSSFLAFDRPSIIPTTLDIFNPVYGRITGSSINAFDGDQLTRTLGIYVQDQVTLTENLKLLLGGRFDLFEQDFRFQSDTTSQSGDAFSPRIGIVYQPIQPISLYASYSRSFVPVEGTAFGGGAFEPERGTQYEIGVKADVNERLSATLALYDLTRTNVTTEDPDNPEFQIQTGEQRSRGIELSIAGEILPGWNIIAGYAYTDAEITEDNTLPVGNRLNNVPENSFNLWTSYEIQQGTLQGLGFGLGFFYIGERQGDLDNSFQLPSYFRTDAAIFYRRDRFRAALNLRNLFDVDYFESATSQANVFPGAPFTVQGTISWEF